MAEIFKTFMAEAEKMDPKGFAKARGERAEMDALRKDAERYRWLRDRAYFDGDEDAATAWCVYGTCHGDAIPTHGDDLDAAVDARILAAPAVGAA